jgi:hypothetical protein
MNFHWQNLNEDHRGEVKGWPYQGRAWLHFGTDARRCIGVEWYLWRRSCALSFGVDEEGDFNIHVALPPVSLWLSLSQVIPTTRPREISLRIHDWALWWTLWRDPMGGWSRSIPRWRQGCFNVLDAVLGRTRYSCETLSEHKVSIPMPEGPYPATLRLEKATWTRPRWFRQVIFRASVDMAIPIPHEGKGENSWDCGKDALHGMTCPAKTVEDAVAEVVRSVLRSRRRYDGNAMAQYPAPAA